PVQPKMQVWSISTSGGQPRPLGEGDDPAVAPKTGKVAFVKDHHIWIAPLDGSKPAEQAFFAKGSSDSPVWSPDGRTLAFVSDRDDHSFIGLFTGTDRPIRYIEPSTSRDTTPAWSPDGASIAFVRQPGRGGVPRSPLAAVPAPWAIWVAEPSSGNAREIWQSGRGPTDSIPRTQGGTNLHWAA